MVRRWSRISLSNYTTYSDYNAFGAVQHLKTFRTTTHFKRFYFGFTKQKRRKAAQKTRLSQLIPYYNVMGSWAQEYRFFRQLDKKNYTAHIFLSAYSIHNNLMYANQSSLAHQHFEKFITYTSTLKLQRYALNHNLAHVFFNYTAQSSLLHHALAPTSEVLADWNPEDTTLSVINMTHQRSSYSVVTTNTSTLPDTLPLLCTQIFDQYLVQLVTIYRLFILLYYSRLHPLFFFVFTKAACYFNRIS